MRPRYLEIEGLQSFRECQKINFDVLGETGLFGIFGPTGSGKSTVLDAITLALYGSVERAVHNTQGIININSDVVRVSFTFDLLKERRKTYVVERVYRKKKNSDTSVENKISRLMEVVGRDDCLVIADRLSDVNSRVEELLGLKLDDFKRSVVLPQNKFQEFLNMKKKDKTEMMERIFYLEEYGSLLREKVSRRLGVVKNKLAGIQGAMSVLGNASGEALKEAEDRMKAAMEHKNKVENEVKRLEEKYNSAKEVWQLLTDLEDISKHEKRYLENEDTINRKRVMYDKAVKAMDLADTIIKFREADKHLADTKGEREEVVLRLSKTGEDLHNARKMYDALHQKAERDKPLLIEQKARLSGALEIKREIAGIDEELRKLRDEYNDLKKRIAEKDNCIDQTRAQMERVEKDIFKCRQATDRIKVDAEYRKEIQRGVRLEEELNNAYRERETLQERHRDLESKVRRLEDELLRLTGLKQKVAKDIDSLKTGLEELEREKPGDGNLITQELTHIHDLKAMVGMLDMKNSDIETLLNKLEDKKTEIRGIEELYKRELERAEGIKASLERIREEEGMLKNRLERSSAYILAKTLKDGHPCPVCGSVHHPGPAVSGDGENPGIIEGKLEDIRVKLRKTEEELRTADGRGIALKEQIKGLKEQLDQVQEDLTVRRNEYTRLSGTLPDEIKKLDLPQMKERLKEMVLENQNRKEALDGWENKMEAARRDIQAKNEILSRYSVDEKGKMAELELNRDSMLQAEKAVGEINQKIRDREDWYRDFIKRLGIRSALAEQERIEEWDREMDGLRRKAEEMQERSKDIRNTLERLREERQEISSRLAQVEIKGNNLKENKLKQEQKIRDIAADGDVDKALEAIEDKLKLLEQKEKQLFEEVKRKEEEYNSLKARLDTLDNQERIYRESLEKEKSQLEAGLTEKGFRNVDEAEGYLLSPDERESLKAGIDRFDRELSDIRTQKNIINRKLGNRHITAGAWKDISEAFNNKQREKEECISQLERTKSEYTRLKASYDEWVKLEKENREYSRKYDMLEQMQRLLRGNGFIEFISEERLRYVAREASETLGVLTKYRYVLELDPEQGFVIRDNANGGVSRAVSSLSGGETFLASLSLALALSKQIQLKGQSPLEFFFLDEGFGTLDSGLLDVAIDALERLSTRERVIGLISHVPELRDRIGRRLIVEPPTPDGRGSRVRIERA